MDNKELIKERLSVLAPGLRTFVLDEKWRSDAEKIGKQFNLGEEKYASFENEVFLVLLCFEPRTDFAENIKMELGIDSNMAEWVAEDVNREIFSQISDAMDLMWQTGDRAELQEEVAAPENKNQVQNNIGESFEQIVLNQARAMQPAVASPKPPSGGGLGYGAAKPAIGASEEPKVIRPAERQLREAPENLPTRQGEGVGVPDYSIGQDPYREPLA